MSENGEARTLHIEDALAVAKHYTEQEREALRFAKGKDEHTLANTDKFCVKKYTVSDKKDFSVDERFASLVVLAGRGAITHNGVTYLISAGDSYFLPAGMGAYTISGSPAIEVLISMAN